MTIGPYHKRKLIMRSKKEIENAVRKLEAYQEKSTVIWSLIAALRWVLGEKIELL